MYIQNPCSATGFAYTKRYGLLKTNNYAQF